MKYLKIWLISSLSLVLTNAIAQEKKKIFFLVDTINISKENRFVEVRNDIEVTYRFYCKCLENKKDIIWVFIQ